MRGASRVKTFQMGEGRVSFCPLGWFQKIALGRPTILKLPLKQTAQMFKLTWKALPFSFPYNPSLFPWTLTNRSVCPSCSPSHIFFICYYYYYYHHLLVRRILEAFPGWSYRMFPGKCIRSVCVLSFSGGGWTCFSERLELRAARSCARVQPSKRADCAGKICAHPKALKRRCGLAGPPALDLYRPFIGTAAWMSACESKDPSLGDNAENGWGPRF